MQDRTARMVCEGAQNEVLDIPCPKGKHTRAATHTTERFQGMLDNDQHSRAKHSTEKCHMQRGKERIAFTDTVVDPFLRTFNRH